MWKSAPEGKEDQVSQMVKAVLKSMEAERVDPRPGEPEVRYFGVKLRTGGDGMGQGGGPDASSPRQGREGKSWTELKPMRLGCYPTDKDEKTEENAL